MPPGKHLRLPLRQGSRPGREGAPAGGMAGKQVGNLQGVIRTGYT